MPVVRTTVHRRNRLGGPSLAAELYRRHRWRIVHRTTGCDCAPCHLLAKLEVDAGRDYADHDELKAGR